MDERQLAVFARAPLLGKVKTRLAGEVGEAEALRAYGCLLQGALHRLQNLACPRILYADGAGLEATAVQYGMQLRRQSGADLGARMAGAIDECLGSASAVALVGVDIPGLDANYVEEAFARLATADLVLGPTEDGGYCLIACKQRAPELFTDMRWGGAEVCAQTARRAETMGLVVAFLPMLWDVDREEDLQRFKRGDR